ncbi:hypothetical protein FKM82_015118, partial [Ascaphus truei]
MVKQFRWELNEDYMTKLHCVRQAIEVVFMKESTKTFMINAGKSILGKFLTPCQKKLCNFEEAYDNLISFIEQPSNCQEIAEAFYSLGVKHVGFYDVVLRFIMQILDDIENIVNIIERGTEDKRISESQQAAGSHGFFYYLGEVFNTIIPELFYAYVRSNSKQKAFLHCFK